MNFRWKQINSSYVFYDDTNGKIYGKVLCAMNNTSFNAFWNNFHLGEFISLESAQKAVENPENNTRMKDRIDSMMTSVKP